MTDTFLTATTTVRHTPDEVYTAVLDPRRWWNENIFGNTAAVSDEFVFTDDTAHAGETSRTKTGIRFARFQISETVPGERVVWHVVDSIVNFVDDHDEWTDTDVVFDISATDDGATLRLTHRGLTQAESECFDACTRGWTYYVATSLPQLLDSGKGQPIAKY